MKDKAPLDNLRVTFGAHREEHVVYLPMEEIARIICERLTRQETSEDESKMDSQRCHVCGSKDICCWNHAPDGSPARCRKHCDGAGHVVTSEAADAQAALAHAQDAKDGMTQRPSDGASRSSADARGGLLRPAESSDPPPQDEAEVERLTVAILHAASECSGVEPSVSVLARAIDALASLARRLLKERDDAAKNALSYIRQFDAGIEFEHIQNCGETFPMTLERLAKENAELRPWRGLHDTLKASTERIVKERDEARRLHDAHCRVKCASPWRPR